MDRKRPGNRPFSLPPLRRGTAAGAPRRRVPFRVPAARTPGRRVSRAAAGRDGRPEQGWPKPSTVARPASAGDRPAVAMLAATLPRRHGHTARRPGASRQPPLPASRRMPANDALPRFTSAAVLLAALAACGGGKAGRGDEAPASAPVPAASAPALPPLRIGLALGGGAAKGFAHIGAIKMLEANGIRADVVAGTSAGSVVGALYASGMDAFTMQERAVALDESTLRDVRLFSGGLVQGQALQDYVNREIGAQPIERLAKPFAAVSTRLDTGDRVVFVRGNTGQAVRASSSVPGVFEPVRIGAHSYVDGGVVSPVPVDAARQLGADVVIAVDISSKA